MKILFALLVSTAALADPIAHITIVDGSHESELALVLPSSGEPSELTVSGPITTKIRLRKAPSGLEFDVEQAAVDHTSFRARGEVAPPPQGKRVTVARIPRPEGGAAEVQLTLK